MSTTVSFPDSRTSLARRALLVNAGFSTFTGVASLLGAGALSELAGPEPAEFVGLGATLLGFAAFVAWVARRRRFASRLVAAISIMDLGWVLGTAALAGLAPQTLTASGWVLAVGVAAVVLGCAIGQLAGLVRASRMIPILSRTG